MAWALWTGPASAQTTLLFEGFEGANLDDIEVSAAVAPSNDAFASSQLLVGNSGTATGTTVGATREPGEPMHAGNMGGHSVWFRWVPTQAGTVAFSTSGSSFDTLLAVYIGASLDTLAPLAQNDDFIPGSDTTSAVTFRAVPGTTYHLALDGYNGASGGFTLRWLFPQTTDTVLDVSHVNYNPFVIDADADNATAGYDRDTIRAAARVRTVNASSLGHFSSYLLQFRLLDAAGVAQPIHDLDGSVKPDRTYSLPLTFTLPALATVTNQPTVALRPAARLNPYVQHRVEVRVLRSGSATAGPLASVPVFHYHFTNRVSADAGLNVIPLAINAIWNRTSAVQTVPGRQSFTLDCAFYLLRYDHFPNPAVQPNQVASVPFRLAYRLVHTATGNEIPLKAAQFDDAETVSSYEPGTNPVAPRVHLAGRLIHVEPVDGAQLDSVDGRYRVEVTLSHSDQPGAPYAPANTVASAEVQLLHFNGKLFFGPIETLFTSLASDPPFVSSAPGFVRSRLSVNNNSGQVTGKPHHVYGDGTELSVLLRSNGNAELTSGSVLLALQPPGLDLGTNAMVRFIRGPVTLSTAGGVADVAVFLPSGFGYTSDITSRYLQGTGLFPAQPLNQNLLPSADPTFIATLWVCEETKPVWIEVNSTTWNVAAGSFVLVPTGQARFVRGPELLSLEAAPVPVEQKLKRSNDSHYRYVTGASGVPSGPTGFPVMTVRAGAAGAAEMTVHLTLGPGRLIPHLPYAAIGTWSGAGQLRIANDLVEVASSFLEGAGPIRVPYNRDCLLSGCGGPAIGPKTNELATDGRLYFTLDGGLAASGALATPAPIQFGYIHPGQFAHETDPFGPAGFLMPGTFLRGDHYPVLLGILKGDIEPTNGPGVICLTGFHPANRAQHERPYDLSYFDPINGGWADYGGLNHRVVSPPAFHGRSRLGNQPTGDYELGARSKYYTRWGGVSGIHEAVPGTFPSQATLYGYQVNFSNFGLAFLDSQNVDSTTQGHVTLPSPAGIGQNFEELTFNCLGDLLDAKVPAAESGVYKLLDYWNADIVALGIKFDRDTAVQCAPGTGFFVLGVQAHASHVKDPLFGFLGFHPNGNLVTEADANPGKPKDLDSRLTLPDTIQLAGPGGESYAVSPVTRAYFNNHDFKPVDAAQGFLGFAADLKASFFKPVEVHVHTGAKTNGAAAAVPVQAMGGWGSPNQGWTQTGKHFFSHTGFDPDNVGYPAAGGGFDQSVGQVAAYRNGATAQFHPRARQEWLDVIPFDYPLAWQPIGRTFRSFEPVVNFDLLVLKSDHQLKYLSADHAELVFGFQSKELPQMNLASLLFKSVDEADGTVTGMAGAFAAGGLSAAYTDITRGLAALDRSLDNQPAKFFDPLLDHLLSARIRELHTTLSNQFNPATKSWTAPTAPADAIHAAFVGSGNSFSNLFKNFLPGTSTLTTGLLWRADTALADASNAVVSLRDLFQGSGGDRPKTIQLTQSLVADIQTSSAKLSTLAKNALAGFTVPKFKVFLENAAPTLDAMTAGLDALAKEAGAIRARVQPGGDWQLELAALFTGDTVGGFIAAAETDVKNYVAGINLAADNPFKHIPQSAFESKIRSAIEDRFFTSPLCASIQTSLRHRLYDYNSAMRQAADTAFAQLNQILRDTLNEVLAGLDASVAGALGKLAKVMATSKVNGYAHINGDDLKELRLDANADFKVTPASQLSGRVYFLYREYDSTGPGGACPPAVSGQYTEVSVGAEDITASWPFGDLEVSVGTKLSFEQVSQTVFPKLKPVNLAGNLHLKNTSVILGDFKIPEVGLVFAAGEVENYLGGKVSGLEFEGYKGAGGVFFGHIACNLDPLKSFDAHVGNNIGAAPFTGLYVYGEVWVPVINLGCLLRASAGVGAGVFYFLEGPTYGGTMKLGVDGKILCFLHATGTVKMTGIKNPDGIHMVGTGTLCGEICVIKCFEKCKSADMTYKNGDFDVDF